MNLFQTVSRAVRVFLLVSTLYFFAPAVFAQAPVLTNAMVVGGNFQMQILIASNSAYTIEISTNLTDWTPVGSDVATNNIVSLVDDRGIAGFSQQFYRIQLGTVVSYNIGFLEFASGGNFGGSFSPATTFPVTLNSYSANLEVRGDTNSSAAATVFFTGPAGSGLTNSPANPDNSSTNDAHANYQSQFVTNPAGAPGGTWTVNYKGSNHVFSVANPQANSRLVVPYPTVVVSGGVLQSVSWVYRDATTGATLSGTPAYLTQIQLQIHGSSQTSELYDSPNLPSGTTSHVLSSPVIWANVPGISLAYEDSLGNNYVVSFGGPLNGP